MSDSNAPAVRATSALAIFAERYGMAEGEMGNTVARTLFPKGQATREQVNMLAIVANEYGLNPFTKEIFAFPNNGGITPLVSIDGWIRIIINHPKFEWMRHKEHEDEKGNLVAITCYIKRKDQDEPNEYKARMVEYRRNTDPWKQFPSRMLRHKATKECGRYTFGFSGIYDADEVREIRNAEFEVKDTSQDAMELNAEADAAFGREPSLESSDPVEVALAEKENKPFEDAEKLPENPEDGTFFDAGPPQWDDQPEGE